MADRWNAWSEELKYLSILDSHRFLKCFAIQDMRRALELGEGPLPATWRPPIGYLKTRFGNVMIGCISKKEGVPKGRHSMRSVYSPAHWCIENALWTGHPFFLRFISEFDYSKLDKAVEEGQVKAIAEPPGPNDVIEMVRLSDMFDAPLLKDHIEKVLGDVLMPIFRKLVEAEKFVLEGEKMKDVFAF